MLPKSPAKAGPSGAKEDSTLLLIYHPARRPWTPAVLQAWELAASGS